MASARAGVKTDEESCKKPQNQSLIGHFQKFKDAKNADANTIFPEFQNHTRKIM
jgi:hypothetical protein